MTTRMRHHERNGKIMSGVYRSKTERRAGKMGLTGVRGTVINVKITKRYLVANMVIFETGG